MKTRLFCLAAILTISAAACFGQSRDEKIMHDLVAFTRTSYATSPMPFAAFVVDSSSGRVLVRAFNRVGPDKDATAHAEVTAIRAASRDLKSAHLKGYTLYTTCEPCPMCSAACMWANLDRVVYGATIGDASKEVRQIHVSARDIARHADWKCDFVGPIDRAECVALFTDPRARKVMEMWRKH